VAYRVFLVENDIIRMGLLAGYLFSGEAKGQAEQGLGGQTSRRKKVLKPAAW
jgi:hypothetical protein